MDTRYAAFGSSLRNLRERAKLTKSQLVQDLRVGVSISMLSLYEKGVRRPRRPIVLNLARALDLSSADTNRLLQAAEHPTLSDEGLETKHPGLIPIAAYFANPDISDEQKSATATELGMLVDIKIAEVQAEKLRVNRKWDEAENKSKSNLSASDKLVARLKWPSFNNSALTLYHRGYLVQAEEELRQSYELSNQLKNPVWQIDDLTHTGDVERLRGYWEVADNSYNSALNIAKNLKTIRTNRKANGLIFRKLAETLLFQGYVKDAHDLLEASLKLFQKIRDKYEIGKTYASIGWAYDLEGKWEKALEYKEQALELSGASTQDEYNIMKAHLYYGDSYLVGGKFEEAKRNYGEALRLSRKLEGLLELSLIELGLARTYEALGQIDDALKFYNDSQLSAAKLNSPYRSALAQQARGACLLRYTTAWQEAKPILEDARQQFDELKTPFYLILTLISLFYYYKRAGIRTEARRMLTGASDLLDREKRIESPFVLSKLALAQAESGMESSRPNEALIAKSLANAYIYADKYNDCMLQETHDAASLVLKQLRQKTGQLYPAIYKELTKNLGNDKHKPKWAKILDNINRFN